MRLGLLLVKKVIDNFKEEIWFKERIKGDPYQVSSLIILIPEAI